MLATEFPYFYVLTDPQFKSGPNDLFWQSGSDVASNIFTQLDDAGLNPETLSFAELGSGVGRVLNPMANLVARVTGYDISSEMIDVCQTHFPNLACHLYTGDLPNKAYDVVYSVITLQHNYPQNQRMMLKDMFQSAKKAVWFNMPEPTGQELQGKRNDAHVPMYGLLPAVIEAFAKPEGFSMVSKIPDPYGVPNHPSWQYLFIADSL